jgi:hypothetical protein
MFAALMVITALVLLIVGYVRDFYRDYTLREKRKALDKSFYEAHKHLAKHFPTDAKRMREAYEFQKTDHHEV